MDRPRHILVSIGLQPGREDPALRQALLLAEKTGASVTAISVLEPLPTFVSSFTPPGVDLDREQEAEALADLKALVASTTAGRTSVQTRIVRGSPARAVIREVHRRGYDLLMKTAEDEDSLLGTLSTRLMRACPCPVYVVDPKLGALPGRCLIALDAEAEDETERSLQLQLLGAASALAAPTAELHALYVRSETDVSFLQGRMNATAYRGYINHGLSSARRALEQLIDESRHPLPDEHVHLKRGRPSAVILEFAAERSIDLIVLGTVARSGMPGFFIGNTAERILRHVTCSVVGVKPDGFVSPVIGPD